MRVESTTLGTTHSVTKVSDLKPKILSTVEISGAYALSLLSGNNPALDALRMWLKDRETASTNVFDTLKNVIYSPGLAQLLSHSSVANPNALAAALLNDLPLFPHNLPSEALSSMTPAAGDTGKDTSSAVVYESMSMAAPDPMASWHANELASAVMAECEGTSAGGAVQALSKLAADGLDEHERVHQVFQKLWKGLVEDNGIFVRILCEGQTFLGVCHPDHQTLHVSPLDYQGLDQMMFADNLSRLGLAQSWPTLGDRSHSTSVDVNIVELD